MQTLTQSRHSAPTTAAAESRFRLNYDLAATRRTNVIALDAAAEDIIRRAAQLEWDSARFYVCETQLFPAGLAAGVAEVRLRELGAEESVGIDELRGADAAIMVATTGTTSPAAAAIGAFCSAEAIMTAGLVVGDARMNDSVRCMRPHARILLVTHDESDLDAILTAIRA